MTDQEIIKGLLERDNRITGRFFFVDCRPLLTSVIRLVFNYRVDYDELVNELYDYLMANDGAKLRQFEFRSSVYQWIKVVAIRYFIRKRDSLIDKESEESPYERAGDGECVDSMNDVVTRIDVGRLLDAMENKRYADALRNLILNDVDPEEYAARIGVSVDNLYNIKKRAIAALAKIAIKYYSYGN